MSNNLDTQNKEYQKKIFYEENLSKYSWFNLGGPAEILFKPDSIEQIKLFIEENKNKDINIIGAGSNTLIRDGGVKGITLKLSSKFSSIKLIDENIFDVGAATLDKKISDFAKNNSVSGFEFLSCIPGSIGGGVRMNSGCYGEEISKILLSIEVMDQKGNIKLIKKEKINFFYRGCDLPEDLIILSVKLKGTLSNKVEIEKKQEKLINKKKNDQPTQVKTCGSTFKNFKKQKAWELIKNSGCDKMQVGQAKISEKHCNFFINNGKTNSKEIEELISKVKNQVFDKTGINLELEIKIIGFNK
jgi:UDP-N-acetylmuramate dehydrogenase|tara:strand:- start:250 stop:1152 length:903 start_codon:yes stop_codon:yes gene_type:complete